MKSLLTIGALAVALSVAGCGNTTGATIDSVGDQSAPATTTEGGSEQIEASLKESRRKAKAAARKRAQTEDRRDAERIYENKSAWLAEKGAVGKTTAEVEDAIGPPSHTQDIGGSEYWYYELGDNMFQLAISDGVVTGVDRY